jgi:hypothetical protein
MCEKHLNLDLSQVKLHVSELIPTPPKKKKQCKTLLLTDFPISENNNSVCPNLQARNLVAACECFFLSYPIPSALANTSGSAFWVCEESSLFPSFLSDPDHLSLDYSVALFVCFYIYSHVYTLVGPPPPPIP